MKKGFNDYFAYSVMTDADREYFGSQTIKFLLEKYEFNTVLDIGCGAGIHSRMFLDRGCNVTAIDYGKSVYFKEDDNVKQIIADFNEYEFEEQFDCVWCCHVLEHQINPGAFLKKVNGLVKEGGILAITVPPLKQQIVGGHVTLWNAGLLLYHLVLAGFDCSDAHVKTYGYNVSVIVKKVSIDVMSRLVYDTGDIKAIREFLPSEINYYENERDTPFDGSIQKMNWEN